MAIPKHKKNVEYLVNHPQIITPYPIIVASNVYLHKENGNDLESEVDVLIFDGDLHLIEYKCNDRKESEFKARKQLQKQERFFKTLGYSGDIIKHYLSGDLNEKSRRFT